VSEIFQLSEADQQQLMRESSFLARSLENEFAGDKLNIAALGNIVPQLHVHHIVRYKTDAAWPAPVWGRVPALAYDESELRALAKKLSDVLQNDSTIEFKPV
ncbi:MAG: hypothetical protein AMS22_06435, partial [Thiotrichales bacterium SG8_50]